MVGTNIWPFARTPEILGAGGPLANTGNTNENTLATVNVPALNVGDKILIDCLWDCTNSANNKTLRTRFGGTLISSTVATTTPGFHEHRHLVNTGAATQVAGTTALQSTGGWGQSATLTALTINTTVATTVTITAQCANSGETITLHSYVVWLIRAR